MLNPSGSQPTREGDHFWLRLLRISALVSCLLAAPGLFPGLGPLLPILAAPFVICYLIVLFGVGGTRGKGVLLLARTVGMFGCCSSGVLLAVLHQMGPGGSFLAYLGLFALAQGAVAVSARKILLSIEGARAEKIRWTETVAGVGVLMFVLLLLAAIILPGLLRSRMAAEESSAAFYVRQINDCLSDYADTHPDQGFPMSLSEMGPEKTGCLDSELVQGERNVYRFAYNPAMPDLGGRMTRYTVSARPMRYGRSANRSYFSDESKGIRYTFEDRAAHIEDPLLQ